MVGFSRTLSQQWSENSHPYRSIVGPRGRGYTRVFRPAVSPGLPKLASPALGRSPGRLSPVLNDFWETAPPAYKYAVFAGMGLTFIGIVILVIGAISSTPSMTFIALPFIGVGLLAHMASLGLRGRNIRKELKAAEKREAARKAGNQ